jgi:hypothetical protein
MFSVTNSGSSNRLTSGDQVKITASATPTTGAQAEAAQDFDGRHKEVREPGIFGRAQRRDGGQRRGQDEFGNVKGVDQHLPEQDHGKMHDQDDRESPHRSAAVSQYHMPPSCVPAVRSRQDNLSRPRPAFNHLVD